MKKKYITFLFISICFLLTICSNENVQAKAKNKNDVRELNKIIRIQKKRGAKVSTNLDNKNQYKWDFETGRLICIMWNNKNIKGKINFNKLNGLIKIYVNNNKIKKIYINELTELGRLVCEHNKIEKLKLGKKLQELSWLDCDNNNISSLKIEDLEMLEVLYCTNNKMNRLILKNLGDIYIHCDHNNLKKLEFKNLSIMGLNCSYNKLVILEDFGVSQYLDCSYNRLKKINISDWDDLSTLECNNNQITELKFKSGGSTDTIDVYCQNNNISELDFSKIKFIRKVVCDNNVNVKGVSKIVKIIKK